MQRTGFIRSSAARGWQAWHIDRAPGTMARMRLAIASVLLIAALLAGALLAASCRTPPAGSPCPCVAGFRCDFDRQVCVPVSGAERAWSPQAEVNQTGSPPDAGPDASVSGSSGVDASADAGARGDETDTDTWVIDAGLRRWR
jgi:hypothetical protein